MNTKKQKNYEENPRRDNISPPDEFSNEKDFNMPVEMRSTHHIIAR